LVGTAYGINASDGRAAGGGSRSLVVATPTAKMHKPGALIVATIAASDGWRVTYLGPSLPAEEIAGAAHQNRARAVALSLVYPGDDPFLRGELLKFQRG
jgi:methylmalonyl-CoA mutase cobalamin-binding subunit